LAEGLQPANAFDVALVVLGALGFLWLGRNLGEKAEPQLRFAEREAVTIGEAGAALLLAVDENFAFAIQLFQLKVAAVEDDLRVVMRDAGVRQVDVVAEGATE